MTLPRPKASTALGYVCISIFQRSISFIMLPFFILLLNPTQYGQTILLTVIFGAACIFLSLGLEISVFRQFFGESSAEGRAARLRPVARFLCIFATGTGAACAGLVAVLHIDVMGLTTKSLAFEILAAGIYVSGSLVPLAVLRASENLKGYALLAGGSSLVLVGSRLAFIVLFDEKATAWASADLVYACATLALGLPWQRGLLLGGTVNARALGESLRQSLPLVPHQAAHFGLALSDRIILASYLSTAAVGIYSANYQIVAISGLLMTELNRATMPRYAEQQHPTMDRAKNVAALVKNQLLAFSLLAGLGGAASGGLIFLMLPAVYSHGLFYTPWIALGQLAFGWYLIVMNIVSLVAGDTRRVYLITLIAVLSNVALNIILIRLYGEQTAAWTTFVAYSILFTGLYWLGRTRWPDLVPIPPRSTRGIGLFCSVLPFSSLLFTDLEINSILRQTALGLAALVLLDRVTWSASRKVDRKL